MDAIRLVLEAANGILWHQYVLFTLLGVGVLFTIWSGFGQYRALTHGVAVIRGAYDRTHDPGAISHFQALSAALSATVGLGNIAGVAIAVSLGGPGAVFWLWVTGFIGMALKMTEVTQAMLYRDLRDPGDPHGGAMWVVTQGFAYRSRPVRSFGTVVSGLFCAALLVSTATGGNMFQAWNVADVTREYFGVPVLVTGLLQTVLVALVIVGGISRIGQVAGRLVPFMCLLYILAGLYVIGSRLDRVPAMLSLIVTSAFSPLEARGAFLGGTFGWAFLRGMQRAFFSNEAGQGSAPIAHAAARTDEPVREGIVAGLEPFIDTICICTITALVILLTGVWDRPPEAPFPARHLAAVRELTPGIWTLAETPLAEGARQTFRDGDPVFAVLTAHQDPRRQSRHHRLSGRIVDTGDRLLVRWDSLASDVRPTLAAAGVYAEYRGATLTAKAFDTAVPGLGFWLIPAVAWLFALSTMISWSYYGEQGIIFLAGKKAVLPYRLAYCATILAASSPLVRTEADLDVISTLGTGLMLWVNIPIMIGFGPQAMTAYHAYLRRLRAGAFSAARPVECRTVRRSHWRA